MTSPAPWIRSEPFAAGVEEGDGELRGPEAATAGVDAVRAAGTLVEPSRGAGERQDRERQPDGREPETALARGAYGAVSKWFHR